jgi:hypothetical protein
VRSGHITFDAAAERGIQGADSPTLPVDHDPAAGNKGGMLN